MTEVLGVVASGIAVGQAVATLGHAIFAVKRLCDELNEIPEKIAYLLEELEILNPIVSDVEGGLSAPIETASGPWNDAAARRAVLSCQRASSALEGVASSLQRRISAASGARKKVASLRALLKKDEVKLLEQRLESAIRILMVAQNCQLTAMVRSQPELIVRRLEATALVFPAQLTGPLPLDSETQNADCVHSHPSPKERYHTDSKDDDRHSETYGLTEGWPQPRRTGQLAFRMRPGGFHLRAVSPSIGWTVQQSWELLLSRSYLGWEVHLQPLIHSPDESLLISLAKKNAVNDLCYLIESGQVTLRHDAKLLDLVLSAAYDADSMSTMAMLVRLLPGYYISRYIVANQQDDM
ncbi:hypothetical protein QBC34DRAFT_442455 [Podospora aff. communis PSN243]|uniref:Fungal N-terminal domain-containing protein n=1 Tax=Podospora aff. communis PSN243 TaxID=3040156 RepID=A0AAV9G9J5_9PEZI|nr:hypothetical protein QBC34DRAFT_442455 [Podospora aff. communis PSN243]